MAIRTSRFVIGDGLVRAVSRHSSTYKKCRGTDEEREVTEYGLEVHMGDHGTVVADYGEDEAARDLDYGTVAAHIE